MAAPQATPPRVAIVGGGWAGMAAAVRLQQAGCRVSVWEAARVWGGRARALPLTAPDGSAVTVDNGQHILIGAYDHCLALLRDVGVNADQALLRRPLDLRYADGQGLQLPDAAPPWDAVLGIARTRGWGWCEKFALLRTAARWQRAGFRCAPTATVASLCAKLPTRLRTDFIDPLCISALNLPAEQASGAVFLRVLRDSVFSGRGGSNLLIPRTDLSQLFPATAATWLAARGAQLHLGQRVQALQWQAATATWQIGGHTADAVVLATASGPAAQLLAHSGLTAHCAAWIAQAQALPHTAIATVYAHSAHAARTGAQLPAPMVGLRSHATAPAQFAFDKHQLGSPAGWLALVVSASEGDKHSIESAAIAQAREQLGWHDLQAVQTVVDKRATFACTPDVQRPGAAIAPGLWACGDYVAGPYPATLEGAVRSGCAAAQAVLQAQAQAVKNT